MKKVDDKNDLHYVKKLKNRFVSTYEAYYYGMLEEYSVLAQDKSSNEIAATAEEPQKLYDYLEELWNHYSGDVNFKSFCKRITPDYKANEKLNDDDYVRLIPDAAMSEFYFPTTEMMVLSGIRAENNGVFIIGQKKYIVTIITTKIVQEFYCQERNAAYKNRQERELRKKILNKLSFWVK